MSYSNDPNSPRRDPGSGDRPPDRDRFYDDRAAQSNQSTAWGMLLGIILASLVGLGIIVWYLVTQRDAEPEQNIILPQQQQTTSPPTPANQPDINITIPGSQNQPTPPPPPDINVPQSDVNITAPSPQQNQQAPGAPQTEGTTNSNQTSPNNANTAPGSGTQP